MSQLYARVFLQILDSSIAEDYMLRHVFEDFFKLVDYKTGVVDITREAMARRLNMPLDILSEHINKLESPDPKSRDADFEGRRLERLDQHRDWGWRILNWGKYENMRNRADVAGRVQKHRENKKMAPSAPRQESKDGITAESIYDAYPLKVGKPSAIRAIKKAMLKTDATKLLETTKAFASRRNGDVAFTPHPSTWFNQERYNDDPSTWISNENTKPNSPQRVDRSIGTTNEGAAEEYRGLGKVVGVQG